jgi:hypothetical protein
MKKTFLITLVLLFLISSAGTARAWEIESNVDDFGSRLVLATTYFMRDIGNTDSYDEAYENGDYEALIIRCQDKKLEAYMRSYNNLFDNSSSALVRFGGGSPQKWMVGRSTSKQSLFFMNTTSLINKMLKVKKFYVRASSTEGYLAANFDVMGLSDLRSTFKKAGCRI